jgi:hypothetical protein
MARTPSLSQHCGRFTQAKSKYPTDHPADIAARQNMTSGRILVYIDRLPPEALPLTAEQIAEIVAALSGGGSNNGH